MIKEFQPLVYNLEKLKKLKVELKDVICPPYDVISPQQHRSLLRKKYNFVNLELPKGTGNTKYKNAKNKLVAWKRSKIFIKETTPAVYVYQHKFTFPEGSNNFFIRTGIFCLIKADINYNNIIPHELTKPKPLEDRYRLISTLNIQTSAPFLIIEDADKSFYTTVTKLAKPQYLVLNITDDKNDEHKIYRIPKGIKEIEKIKSLVEKHKLFIADGHHRYRVTCEYLKKIKKEYLMVYICSSSDDGLLILPTHRAVAGKHIYEELNKYFDFVNWDGKKQPEMVAYSSGEFKVLKPKKELYKSLKEKVYIHPYFVLDKILCELEGEQIRQQMFYHYDMKEVVSFADRYNGCAFIMPQITKEEFVSIVKSKKIFPPKSTYFYPKVACGFLFYDFEY